MTRLFLIRHGETTDLETKKVFKGTIDIPLSTKGRDRIKETGGFLSQFTLGSVYTSALSRSMESGKIIALPHNLPIIIEPALNEIRFGLWEGLSFDEISHQYPKELDLWLRDPEVHSPPGGESLREAEKRILPTMNHIIDACRGQNVAIVAHGGVLRVMVCYFLQMKLTNLFKIGQDNGCTNIIDIYDDNNAVLQLLNYTVNGSLSTSARFE